jgi:hypothetical protein
LDFRCSLMWSKAANASLTKKKKIEVKLHLRHSDRSPTMAPPPSLD